ncbi:MAG: DUF111 family protein [Deltaproteobacteria bacterium]|nr:DUF111 family protein [Deltaproteobacteria bacterium]
MKKRRANAPDVEAADLVVIEANIDDMNPEWFEYLIERLLAAGAVDVTVRPVLMKKRRLAAQLQVLCVAERRERLVRIIFAETTTFGVRFYPVERCTLRRVVRKVRTPHGLVPVKCGWLGDELLQCSPEYEACKAIARKRRVPLREIYRLAVAAALR